jgi:hypothetical protein
MHFIRTREIKVVYFHSGKRRVTTCEISGSHGGEYEVTVFGDVAQCSFIGVDRSSRGAYCLLHQVDESWR